jgi:hypothetical protein
MSDDVCPNVGLPVMPKFLYSQCNISPGLLGCPSTNYVKVWRGCPILREAEKVKERIARLETLKL